MILNGGMLTGAEIERQIKKGNISITPYDPDCLNPNSYNLKLYPELLVYSRQSSRNDIFNEHLSKEKMEPLDMKSKNDTIRFIIPDDGYVLKPGVLYIGRTLEYTSTNKYIPMINGRSSGGRLGISIHVCAGFGDIGFSGTWTLEMTVVEPVRIYPYVEIAQVCYFNPVGKIGKLYRGRYFGQKDATASRFYKSKEK